MTRIQVARALGRSIATVRRIEGLHLHPQKGVDGVHRLDPEEVRQLQTDITRGAVRLAPPGFPNHDHHAGRLEPLERENRILRELLQETVDVVRLLIADAPSNDALDDLLDAAEEFIEA